MTMYAGMDDSGTDAIMETRPPKKPPVQFRGVLLKPLDQQADRDGHLIDPAGVKFDADAWIPIWRNFSYTVPDDLLGRGKVRREEDGSLVVDGELFDTTLWGHDIQQMLAIGVSVRPEDMKPGYLERGDVIYESTLMASIALTTQHQDPTQPPIVITHTPEGSPMNLGRIGHYHTPTGDDDSGFCQKADVIKVWSDELVNLDVTDSNGRHEPRTSVAVSAPQPDKATFHLAIECPYGR